MPGRPLPFFAVRKGALIPHLPGDLDPEVLPRNPSHAGETFRLSGSSGREAEGESPFLPAPTRRGLFNASTTRLVQWRDHMNQRPATTRARGAFALPQRPTGVSDRPGPRPEDVVRPLEPELWAAISAGLKRLDRGTSTTIAQSGNSGSPDEDRS